MHMKTLTILKKNRKYFAALINGYKCRIVIDDNSKNLELGEQNLLVDDLSIRTKYGADLIFKLATESDNQEKSTICTLKHPFYNVTLIEQCRNLGGRYDKEENAWVFTSIVEDKVEELDELYNSELLNIEVDVLNNVVAEREDYCMFGRPIARAYDRDSGAKLCDGIAMITGKIRSGGSKKYWDTVICADTVLRFQVPQKLYEKYEDEYLESGDFNFRIL